MSGDSERLKSTIPTAGLEAFRQLTDALDKLHDFTLVKPPTKIVGEETANLVLGMSLYNENSPRPTLKAESLELRDAQKTLDSLGGHVNRVSSAFQRQLGTSAFLDPPKLRPSTFNATAYKKAKNAVESTFPKYPFCLTRANINSSLQKIPGHDGKTEEYDIAMLGHYDVHLQTEVDILHMEDLGTKWATAAVENVGAYSAFVELSSPFSGVTGLPSFEKWKGKIKPGDLSRLQVDAVDALSEQAKTMSLSDPFGTIGLGDHRQIKGDKTLPELATTLDTSVRSIVDKVRSLSERAKNLPLRFAVCGAMSHGKSTVINQIIGDELLHAEERATTGWPLIIRNDPDRSEPKLELNPGHFDPFLKVLREAKITESSSRWKDWDPRAVHYVGLSNEVKSHLLEFEEPGFTLPKEVEGKDNVIRWNSRINTLIRLSYMFAESEQKRPQVENNDWPLLTVAFNGIEGLPNGMELVDLPGNGEAYIPEGDTKAQWEDVIGSSHGTIFVFKASGSVVDEKSGKAMRKNIVNQNGRRPLIAVGTHSDTLVVGHRKPKWTQEATNVLLKEFSIPPERLCITSPFLYLSAHYALQVLPKQGPEQKLPPWEDICCTLASDALKKYFLEGDGWASTTIEDAREKMQKIQKAYGGHQTLEALRTYMSDGAKLYQTRTLADEFKLTIEVLGEAYKSILDAANKQHRSHDEAERQCSVLQNQTTEFCYNWYSTRVAFTESSLRAIQDYLDETREKALKETSLLVRHEANGNADEVYVTFHDRYKAVEFLSRVESQLKRRLTLLQDELVENVRRTANSAWKNCLEDLKTSFRLEMFDTDGRIPLAQALQEEVSTELDHISATPMIEAIRKQIDKRISETRFGPFSTADKGIALWARAKAEMAAFSKGKKETQRSESFMSRWFRLSTPDQDGVTTRASLGSSTKSISLIEDHTDNWEGVSRPEELGADMYNTVGFLMRAPVLASASGDSLTTEIWPFLKEPAHKKVTLGISDVIRKYHSLAVSSWFEIIQEECHKSVTGAIDISSGQGLQTVLLAMKNKTKKIKESSQLAEMPLDKGALEGLILSRANCEAALAAASILAHATK